MSRDKNEIEKEDDVILLIDQKANALDRDSTPKKNKTGQQKHSEMLILSVVAFYWAVSLSVVFLNKYIFSSSEYKFPYPLLVTWYQLIVALVLLVACGYLGQRGVKSLSVVPPYEFDLTLAKKILPLTIVYVLMLALNNLCLNYVHVTFYQIARSLTILFNIGLTYFMLKQSISYAALVSCLVVFLGFLLGSVGEINFSWLGLIFGVGSSFFVALYGIYVKKTLNFVDNDQWRLLHYNTTNAIVVLFPIIVLSGELSEVMSSVNFLNEFMFWFVMTITGVTGFLINIAVFLQIKVTTPLTNTISGTAKACVQTLLAWAIWQNEITATNAFGIFLSLFGSGLYSYVRYKEMKK
ncbi:hypothetical protein MIR68_009627 [Amoeboaphelidium protococcarum]|nr:hypothetical protein MIR68_009627 [Amoeboaphelidium protococcarum]KAI3646416.1 hypothetical protein MP228_009344 [Amoeboaphelidium protococcarum]